MSMNSNGKLTNRQKQVLEVITSHKEKFEYPPTLEEIAQELGVNSRSGIRKHLAALEKKGYIKRAKGKARGLAVVRDM